MFELQIFRSIKVFDKIWEKPSKLIRIKNLNLENSLLNEPLENVAK